MTKTNEYFLWYRTGSIHPEIVCTTVEETESAAGSVFLEVQRVMEAQGI